MAQEPKRLHPFFTTPKSGTRHSDAKGAAHPACEAESDSDSRGEEAEEIGIQDQNQQRRKRQKTGPDAGDYDQPQKRRPGRPRKKDRPSAGTDITNHFPRLDCDSLPREPEIDELANRPLANDTPKTPPRQDLESAAIADFGGTGSAENDEAPKEQPDLSRPKKLLRFNPKTGTIGSPPKAKPSKSSIAANKAPSEIKETCASKVVRIRYGSDEQSRLRIGARIKAILAKKPVAPSANGERATNPGDSKQDKSQPRDVPKEAHPFFLGKAKKEVMTETEKQTETKKKTEKQENTKPVRAKLYSSTPCSPRKPHQAIQNMKPPQYSIKSTGLKIPGAMLPAWPCKGMAHVRGEESLTAALGPAPQASSIRSLRKSKGHTVHISEEESGLARATTNLDIPGVSSTLRGIDTDQFSPPPPELRLPRKHFESGRKLQERVFPELKTSHPALTRLYNSIRTGLSAFDRSECEPQTWAQKYAPISAAEVLQSGKEAFLLKEWLEALKVQSIDTGPADGDQTRPGGGRGQKADTSGRKRKRKNKLDGFIVDSDEEANEMDEISEEDTDWSPSSSQGRFKKTVIRVGDSMAKALKDRKRLTNSVVISGPHGSGKTAAVYAIARELDFEVFEISSSSRRSGKDVAEKIGDMTRNHLVQHHAGSPDAEDRAAIDDEVSKDIRSGRQATMNSFFKAKPAAKAALKIKQSTVKPAPGQPSLTKRAIAKSRKQSLILLEEVDILYEEDKQFWATVIALIAQSKRPCIMTCNDEALVPLQALNLHGIFRFGPPPTDVAVDALISIAANEGHALRREAVEALHAARNFDLRASLMDLNYWCQIGVGDRRGGFDWFFPRWPRGIDQDEKGDVVRVISEATYERGMGWIGHEGSLNKSDLVERDERLLLQAWDNWQLDLTQWRDSGDPTSWVDDLRASMPKPGLRSEDLERYEEFADAMSASDVASHMAFAKNNQIFIDASQPHITDKAREDYIAGLPLLETPPGVQYNSLDLEISISLKLLARRCLLSAKDITHTSSSAASDSLGESWVVEGIERSHLDPCPSKPVISRLDHALAFDPLASTDGSVVAVAHLDPSIFDRTMEIITVDVAPFVRGIVAYDSRLQEQRLQLSNLMSQGGSKKAKRMRTTRAAYSAMEGGQRSTTRAEKWFKAELNPHLVMATGGKGWTKAAAAELGDGGSEVPKKKMGRPKKNRYSTVIDDDESSDGQDRVEENADADADIDANEDLQALELAPPMRVLEE